MQHSAEILLFVLVDLAIIIAAARLCGALARKIGQPVVIGEILAGMILGPTVLGRISPDLPAQLFPLYVPLRQLADLGLVFFMFLVGLELDPRLIRKEGRRALAVSLSGIIVPFALGALIGIPLLTLNNGGVFAEATTKLPTPLTFSLFMGAAMCITAFPVLARVLTERGLYKSPLGTLALCAAAIDDVTAWILLAAIVGIARSGSVTHAGSTLVLGALFVLVMLTAVRPVLSLLAKRYDVTGRLTVDQVAVIVIGLLLSAYATEWIGIHAIFGAFIFGTIMPHTSRMTRELTDKVEDFTVVVLLPVFFAVTGLRTNLFSINNPELFVWMILIIGAAIFGKMAGCGLAAKLSGCSTRESLAVGSLMNMRGLTELVILTVGLTLGVLSDRTFAMMVVMALVTTFMAAPILDRVMPRREMVRVLAGAAPEPVACRILVALGNPENARSLVDVGVRFAGRERPAELLLVRLIPMPRAPEFRTGLRDEEIILDRSIDAMERIEQQAVRGGVTARPISFLSEDVGQDLAYVAATQRCDTILLGWHRASLDRRVVRALVHRVFTRAPCHVGVFVDRHGAGLQPQPGRSVLILPVSRLDEHVVAQIGRRLADGLDTDVRVIGRSSSSDPDIAENGPELVDAKVLETVARETANAVAAIIMAGTVSTEESDFGEPATQFAAVAQCPVLVVRPASGVRA
jgi:Kef-type K+ transport system membrane component KefB/nucleotide-binding universal stress UspA family protein